MFVNNAQIIGWAAWMDASTEVSLLKADFFCNGFYH